MHYVKGSQVSHDSICRTAGSLVLQRGGVIRGITNWGVFHMPKPTKGSKGGTRHHIGHYFVMRFDSNAPTQHAVRRTLGLEPRMLRFSVVKLGSSLEQIANVQGETEEWANIEGGRGMQRDDAAQMKEFDFQMAQMERERSSNTSSGESPG
jgi:small subunit ribosomal protein S6